MKRHANIPIFIPHLGCPNQCVFCNQRTISGVNCFDVTKVDEEISSALSTINANIDTEIAFFGGSFTGIGIPLMTHLLEIAYSYVQKGQVTSIRCSTRPDYINSEILDILKKYGVKTIELGLQSSIDSVLSASKRGHSFLDEKNACKMIVERGFDLVGQMMIGLPGANIDHEIQTAEFIVKSGAKAARIYPTVVFRDTELYDMAISGKYNPITLTDAVDRSAKVLEIFENAGVETIRIGLCAQDNLFDEDKYYAGPNHPALGELVIGEFIYNKLIDYLSNNAIINDYITITVPKGMYSKAAGHKRVNITRLVERFGFSSVTIKESDELFGYEFRIEFERN